MFSTTERIRGADQCMVEALSREWLDVMQSGLCI